MSKTFWPTEVAGSMTEEQVELGLRDAQGRGLGYRVLRYLVTWAQSDRGDTTPGGEFVCEIQATRAGNTWGAPCRRTFHRTEASRESTIIMKIADGRKRFAAQTHKFKVAS